jgi:branched-chain amino acid transport system permease protein
MAAEVGLRAQSGHHSLLKRYGLFLFLLLAAISPLINPWPYAQKLITDTLIYGTVAMALDLLMGYTGMVSLGQAAFFALGAYTTGILTTKLEITELLITLPLAILVPSLYGLLTGYFAVKSRDIYFLMLTLAFSMMIAAGAHKWTRLTGGDDGMRSISRPTLFGQSLEGDTTFFYVVLLGLLGVWYLLRRVVNSPFGQVLVGIRENEHRMAALGYRTRHFKLAAFVLAGAVSGVAGWMVAGADGYVSPHAADWSLSGMLQLMVIIGGMGTLGGPLIGTSLVLLLRDFGSSYTERWEILLGGVFIFFVLVAPQGILGLFLQRGEGSVSISDSLRRFSPWKR